MAFGVTVPVDAATLTAIQQFFIGTLKYMIFCLGFWDEKTTSRGTYHWVVGTRTEMVQEAVKWQ
jgi:hypothetical protein